MLLLGVHSDSSILDAETSLGDRHIMLNLGIRFKKFNQKDESHEIVCLLL